MAELNLTNVNQDLVLKNHDLVIKDENSKTRMRLDAKDGVRLKAPSGETIVHIDTRHAAIRLGGFGINDGDLVIFPKSTSSANLSEASIRLDGATGSMVLGSLAGRSGKMVLRDRQGKQRILVDGKDQQIIINNSNGQQRVKINAKGNLALGGNGTDGDILLNDGEGRRRIHLDTAGGTKKTETRVYVDGRRGKLVLGGDGNAGDLIVRNSQGENTIVLDGEKGDIRLLNADLAEDFDVVPTASELEAGTVMVIADVYTLEESSKPYDRRVAGVVSGGGIHKPGIILDKRSSDAERMPIALTGKVLCKVDTGAGAIAVGDLLTTSATPGHAMKVNEPERALGAVIGKALAPLDEGTDLIPILVALH